MLRPQVTLVSGVKLYHTNTAESARKIDSGAEILLKESQKLVNRIPVLSVQVVTTIMIG
jgi:uncharacterized membrane protein